MSRACRYLAVVIRVYSGTYGFAFSIALIFLHQTREFDPSLGRTLHECCWLLVHTPDKCPWEPDVLNSLPIAGMNLTLNSMFIGCSVICSASRTWVHPPHRTRNSSTWEAQCNPSTGVSPKGVVGILQWSNSRNAPICHLLLQKFTPRVRNIFATQMGNNDEKGSLTLLVLGLRLSLLL
jgi:hypothetical protein